MQKIPGWVWLAGAIAAGLYLTRKTAAAAMPALPGGASSPASSPVTGAVAALEILPGSSAATAAQVSSAGTFWSSLTPTSPPSSGYINLPSGTQVAAANMIAGNTAMDEAGNLYVLWGGQVYSLSGPDAQGNWPATLFDTGS